MPFVVSFVVVEWKYGLQVVVGLGCLASFPRNRIRRSCSAQAMFNAPRSPSNRYGSPLSNGLLGSTTSLASDPLIASAYIDPDAGLDPWSINPSPAPLADPPSALNAVLGTFRSTVLSVEGRG